MKYSDKLKMNFFLLIYITYSNVNYSSKEYLTIYVLKFNVIKIYN